MKSIQYLVDNKIVSIKRGNEIGSEFYGKGTIPFIRTSDIVNWEIKNDPMKTIPYKIYEQYKTKQDVQENDILFVKDGSNYLIGNCAFITSSDTKIVFQSHILKIRVLDDDYINPLYLLYLLNLPFVRSQIRQYTFIQGTIPSLGNRFLDIKIPISKNKEHIMEKTKQIKNIIDTKQKLKDDINKLFE